MRFSLATTGGPPCQQGGISERAQITMPVFELDKLPEDTLRHVHSFLPLRDAARSACVSHKFLRSWRCFPNLTFNQETLGLNAHEGTSYEKAKKFIDRVNHIIQNHSGIGVNTLKFEIFPCHNVITANHLDIWFQDIIKSGIQEIAVRLQTIEIYAPKLTSFMFRGPPIEILINDSSQLKHMVMHGAFYSGMIRYAQTKLHSIASNLQTLTLSSSKEEFNMPSLAAKFLHLKHLSICFFGEGFQSYDYLTLVSFLEACPFLECFFLSAGECYNVEQQAIQHSNANSSHLRGIPEFLHANLKKVHIERFCCAKSLIELTCQIVENTSSLRSLVLDTTHGFDPRGTCKSMRKEDVIQAIRAVEAIKSHIEGKIPSSVKFKVREPCRQCHITKL
ncbi:hypothetical protein ACP70R_017640 [Stipagrostis hirtigluma subsp. patula]